MACPGWAQDTSAERTACGTAPRMGLLSILQKNHSADAQSAKKSSADEVQQVRKRARQRLIGAVVLLGIGVIGFPLVFETQPRPIPVDIPIEIPRKDNAPPLAVPAPRAKPAAHLQSKPAESVITESAADAGKEVPAPTPPPEKPAPAKAAPDKPAEPHEKPVASPKAAPEKSAQAETPHAKPAAKAEEMAKDGRFIVQVGAFSEANSARETRAKVEKLGLKTYTQVVDTDGGKRIRVRVGPFTSREEADKAAGRIKSAGRHEWASSQPMPAGTSRRSSWSTASRTIRGTSCMSIST